MDQVVCPSFHRHTSHTSHTNPTCHNSNKYNSRNKHLAMLFNSIHMACHNNKHNSSNLPT